MKNTFIISETEKKTIRNLHGLIMEETCVGNCKDGEGTLTADDGTISKGTFKGGKLNGKGKVTYTNGTVEEGMFKDGKLIKRFYVIGNIRGDIKTTNSYGKDIIVPNKVGVHPETKNKLYSLTTLNNRYKTATIVLQHQNIPSIKYEKETDSYGNFNFTDIEIGPYYLSVNVNLFKKIKNIGGVTVEKDKDNYYTIIIENNLGGSSELFNNLTNQTEKKFRGDPKEKKEGKEKKIKPLTSSQECEQLIIKYYDTYAYLYKNPKQILTQINKDNIEDEKERLIGCHVWYIQNNVKMSNTTKDYFEKLKNVHPSLEFMEINQQISEEKNNELELSIKNKLKEQIELKLNGLVEEDIVSNRFNFILKQLTNSSEEKVIFELKKEKKKLINFGYDSLKVNNTFFNIMNTIL